MLIYFSC